MGNRPSTLDSVLSSTGHALNQAENAGAAARPNLSEIDIGELDDEPHESLQIFLSDSFPTVFDGLPLRSRQEAYRLFEEAKNNSLFEFPPAFEREELLSEFTDSFTISLEILRHTGRNGYYLRQPDVPVDIFRQLSFQQKALVISAMSTDRFWPRGTFNGDQDTLPLLLMQRSNEDIRDLLDTAISFQIPPETPGQLYHIKRLLNWWNECMKNSMDGSWLRLNTLCSAEVAPITLEPNSWLLSYRLMFPESTSAPTILKIIACSEQCSDEDQLGTLLETTIDALDRFRAGLIIAELINRGMEPTQRIRDILATRSGIIVLQSAFRLLASNSLVFVEEENDHIKHFKKMATFVKQSSLLEASFMQSLKSSILEMDCQEIFDAYNDMMDEPRQNMRVEMALRLHSHLQSAQWAPKLELRIQDALTRISVEVLREHLEAMDPFNPSSKRSSVLEHLLFVSLTGCNLEKDDAHNLLTCAMQDLDSASKVSLIIDLLRAGIMWGPQHKVIRKHLKNLLIQGDEADASLFPALQTVIDRSAADPSTRDISDIRNLTRLTHLIRPLSSGLSKKLNEYLAQMEPSPNVEFQTEIESLAEILSPQDWTINVPSNLNENETIESLSYMESVKTKLRQGHPIDESFLRFGRLTSKMELLRLIMILANREEINAAQQSDVYSPIRPKLDSHIKQIMEGYTRRFRNDMERGKVSLRHMLDRALRKIGIPKTVIDLNVSLELIFLWDEYTVSMIEKEGTMRLNSAVLSQIQQGLPGMAQRLLDLVYNIEPVEEGIKAIEKIRASDIVPIMRRFDSIRRAMLLRLMALADIDENAEFSMSEMISSDLCRRVLPSDIWTTALQFSLPHFGDESSKSLQVVTKLVDLILEFRLNDQKMIDELKKPFCDLDIEDFTDQYRRLAGFEFCCDEPAEVEPTEIHMIPEEELALEPARSELTRAERQPMMPVAPVTPPPMEVIPDAELVIPVMGTELRAAPIIPNVPGAPIEAPAVTIDAEEIHAATGGDTGLDGLVGVSPEIPVIPTPPLAASLVEIEEPQPREPDLVGAPPIARTPVTPPEPLVAPLLAMAEPEPEPRPEPDVPVVVEEPPPVPIVHLTEAEPAPEPSTDIGEVLDETEIPRPRPELFSYLDYMRRRRQVRDRVTVIAGVPPNYGDAPPPLPRQQYPRPMTVEELKAAAEAKRLAQKKRLDHDRTISLAAMTSVILGFSIMGYAMYELAAFDHSYY